MDCPLTLQFAQVAAVYGWRHRILVKFCTEQGITETHRRKMWPNGIRTIADQFNTLADDALRAHFKTVKSPTMVEVFNVRFLQNAPYKKSVRRLAFCDAFHPLDTIRRTSRTVTVMRGCHARTADVSILRNHLLLVAYSLCVLVWVFDFTKRQMATTSATRLFLTIIQEH